MHVCVRMCMLSYLHISVYECACVIGMYIHSSIYIYIYIYIYMCVGVYVCEYVYVGVRLCSMCIFLCM